MAKFCGKCGSPLDTKTGKCPKCDIPDPPVSNSISKKRKHLLPIAFLLATAAVVLCLGILFFNKSNSTPELQDVPCPHDWEEATCLSPMRCKLCGETVGKRGDHNWTPATCSAPETCSVCGATIGTHLEHLPGRWEEGYDFLQAKNSRKEYCSLCGEVIKTQTVDMTSFVKNGRFLFTPQQFYDRMVSLLATYCPEAQPVLVPADLDGTPDVIYIRIFIDDTLEYVINFIDRDTHYITMEDLNSTPFYFVSVFRYRLIDLDNGDLPEPIPGDMLTVLCQTCDPAFSDDERLTQVLMQTTSYMNAYEFNEGPGYNQENNLLYSFLFGLTEENGHDLDFEIFRIYPNTDILKDLTADTQ